MSRKLRLKCPACGTLIETSVEDELRITLQCAACHHQFSAKVPTRAENSPAATSRPTVAARPVTAKPTSGPVAARPVAARPVAARPAATMPVTSAPIAPTPPASDPLFGGVAEFNFPVAPTAYQPVRKRKPINLRPLLTICGSILGVCLAITLGVYGWHWAANTDWSTFSLTRDTPEQMLAEVYAKSEEHGKDSINMLTDQAIDYEQVKKRFLQTGKWAERFLVRSVRLGKVPEKLKPAFRDKMAALIKSNHEATRAKLDELKASGRQPTGDQTRYTELMLEPDRKSVV